MNDLPTFRITIELIRPIKNGRNHVTIKTLDTGRIPVDHLGIDELHPRLSVDVVSRAFEIRGD